MIIGSIGAHTLDKSTAWGTPPPRRSHLTIVIRDMDKSSVVSAIPIRKKPQMTRETQNTA